jgi:lipopolysaccharide export system protein LptA
MAVLGVPLAASSVSAAPPEISAAEKAALQADAAPGAMPVAGLRAEAKASLEKDTANGAALSKEAATFLADNEIPAVPADAIPAPTKPLEVKGPGPDFAVINCDGGLYFDSEQGVLVYLKNVTVKHPEFNLSGVNEAKVFFEKKPEKAPDKNKADSEKPSKDSSGIGDKIGANFGEPERVVATGAVLFEQTKPQEGKEPIKASGAVFTYNPKTGIALLSGGYPWVLQGANYARAKEANMTFRIDTNTGTAVVEKGQFETGFVIPDKKDKSGEPKKDSKTEPKKEPKKESKTR